MKLNDSIKTFLKMQNLEFYAPLSNHPDYQFFLTKHSKYGFCVAVYHKDINQTSFSVQFSGSFKTVDQMYNFFYSIGFGNHPTFMLLGDLTFKKALEDELK